MNALRVLWTVGLMSGLAALLGWSGSSPAARPPQSLAQDVALKLASVKGKYQMLLRQIRVETDGRKHKGVYDAGLKKTTEYVGYADLPQGHWVYVHPYWYIWRDRSATPKNKRPWGPEQATGEPDTKLGGDSPTAWASQEPNGHDEWLLLEYAEPVVPTAVLVHESFNPGALTRVTLFKLDGTEFEAWSGKDPTAANSGMGVSEIPVKVDFKTNRVKLYLDSTAVPGWNEIDAVGLRDKADKTRWATAAEASSTFAMGPYTAATEEYVIDLENRVDRLEAELLRLKQANQKLQQENWTLTQKKSRGK